jgi:aldose sugar dehydrogenase
VAMSLVRPTLSILALAALMACSSAAPGATSGAGADRTPEGLRVRTYRGGLDFPIDMAWVRGTNKIFFTEKSGRIRVMLGKKLLEEPCATFNVQDAGESGLLGIALDPKFKKNHHLFVYYTNASPRQNRVARVTVEHNVCKSKKDIVKGLPASSGYHNGGQLEFVGRHLFVSVGENHGAGSAQNKSGRLGKVLRYDKDGSIPRSNPFSTRSDPNPVWSYGHRNPFGLARRPGTNRLYETENGPDCDDEVNFIRKGRNYGWGDGYDCGTKGVGSNPKGPLKRWTPTIVPTDPWWYRGRIKSLSGSLLMGDYGTGRLHELELNGEGTKVNKHRIVLRDEGIVDVAKGPGGWVYFLTSSAIKRITT